MSAKQTKQPLKKQPAIKHPSTPVIAVLSEDVIAKRMIWFLFAAAFLLFANTLGHGFVLDDVAVIEQNKFVQQGISGIPKIVSTFYWEGYWESNAGLYRPLSLICFAVEWAISPNNSFIHHFINVLLYAVSIALLFRLLRKLLTGYSVWISFFISLLFAVHPIHSEVVANIKSRDEILCFLFFVLTFHYLLKNDLSGLKAKLVASALFLLCLLSKEAGILFLPVIGAYFVLFRKDSVLKTTTILLPLIIISALWLCLHQYIIQTSPFERITYTYLDNSLVACDSSSSQIATGIAIAGHYLLKTVFPSNMSYDYSYNQIPCETFGSPIVLITLAVIAGLIFLIYKYWKSHPVISFGLLFFFISTLLVTNIFTLIGTTMGDRLLFAPVLGICMVIVYGAYRLLKQVNARTFSHSAAYGFSLLAIVASVAAVKRNKDWESNSTLFKADVIHAPNSARTHFNYGVVLMGELPENTERQASALPAVIAAFNRSIAIDPNEAGSHMNLGVCYYRLKDYSKSIEHTRKVMEIRPADKAIYNNLADAYFKTNALDSAIVYYQKTFDAKLATANTYNFMGVALFNKKDYPEAIAVFNEGMQHFPENTEMLMNLGSAYGASENYPKALETFQRVLAITPGNKQVYRFLAMTYESLGDIPNTQKYFKLYQSK